MAVKIVGGKSIGNGSIKILGGRKNTEYYNSVYDDVSAKSRVIQDIDTRVSNREYLSPDDLETYKSAIQDYANGIHTLKGYDVNLADTTLDKELKSMGLRADSISKFYSGYSNADEYNEAIRKLDEAKARGAKYEAYDREAGQSEIDRLQLAVDSIPVKPVYNNTDRGSAALAKSNAYNAEMEKWSSTYGMTPEEAKKSLLEKTEFHSAYEDWKLQQDYYYAELPDAKKYTSIGKNADLESVGSTVNKSFATGGTAITYHEADELRAAATALAIHNGKDGGEFADNYKVKFFLDNLTDEEFNRLAYYIGKDQVNGTNETEQYLFALEYQINARLGSEIFTKVENKPLIERGAALVVGLDQFAQGVKGLGSEGKQATSPWQYAGSLINEDLADSGLSFYNFATGKWQKIKIAGRSTGQLIYEANVSTGNMLPSMLVSAAIGTVSKTAGAAVGAALMGASAGGNARQEMLNLGYSKEQANAYGALVGASEAGLSYMLSGIPGLRGGDGVFSALGSKVLKKVDNALAKVAITLGGDMLDEGLEEGLQTVLESWFKGIATNTDWDAPNVDEVLYSSLLGMLTSIGLGGGKVALSSGANAVQTAQLGKSIRTSSDILAKRGMDLEGTKASDLAKKVQNRLDKGKSASNYTLGKLYLTMSDSQMSSSIRSQLGEGSEKIADGLTSMIRGKDYTDATLKAVIENAGALSILNDTLGTGIKAGNSVREARSAIDSAFERTVAKTPVVENFDRQRVFKSLSVNLGVKQAEKFADTIEALAKGDVGRDRDISEMLKNKYARNAANKYLGKRFTESTTVNEVREAMAEGKNGRDAQALVFGASLGMSENGIRGLISVAKNTGGSMPNVAQAYNAVYRMGLEGKAITDARNPHLSELTPAQKSMAYEYGVMDSLMKPTEELATSWETDEVEAVDEAVDEAVAEEAPEKTPESTSKKETITPIEKLSKEQQKLVDAGKKIGVEVVVADIKKGKENIDGLFNGKTLYVNPNTNSGDPMITILKHELTHYIEKSGEYGNFSLMVTDSKAFREWLKDKGFKNTQEYLTDITAKYKKIGKDLSKDNKAHKEMIANFVGDTLFANDDSLDRFVSEMTTEQKRTFRDFLRGLIDWFRKVFGDGNASDEIAVLEKKYGELFRDARETATKSDITAEKYVAETKDTQYNYTFAEEHKKRLEGKITASSTIPLETLMARYDKILEIWNRLGGQLNSKFMNEWNSKQGKDRAFTVFKAQSGYKYNVELSSMCKKGVPLFEAIDTIVKEEAMKELKVDKLGKAEKEILYDLLKSDGFDIPCAICYVEQARQREGAIIDAFLHGTEDGKIGWNSLLHEVEDGMRKLGVDYTFPALDRSVATDKYVARKLTMTEAEQDAFYKALKEIANREITKYNEKHVNDKKFKPRRLVTSLTPEAITDCFKGNISADIKIFKVLFQNPNSRFIIESDLLYASTTTHNLAYAHQNLYSLFNQQGGVSGYKTKQGNVVYWGDILDKKWEASKLRKEGGIRYQSNSDSQMYTLLDQVQMFIDLTAKGYYLQSYSKVLSYLKLLGLSKGKINASLIPKVVVYRDANGDVDVAKTQENAGLDENGKPIYDDIEGIDHKEAFMLIEDPDYSRSVGGVCIGYSDNHIRALLDDSRIQLIIGFHDKTNNPDKRYRGARYAKNYNGLNEAVDSEGKTVHIGFNQFVQSAEKMFTKSGESFTGTVNHNGKEYTANDIPHLAADLYLEHCEKKGYSPAYNIEGIVGHPNYYKLLADFSLYDSKGNYAPHQKVEYNMPDQVPYLDENGHKHWMKSERYIKNELEKELNVRDDIAAKLADKSEAGLIPRFIKAVNGESNENTLDNQNDVEYNEDDSQYAYNPSEDELDITQNKIKDIYTSKRQFAKEVVWEDRSAFTKHLSSLTKDMNPGEVRLVEVNGASRIYLFIADGHMSGTMYRSISNKRLGLYRKFREDFYNGVEQNREGDALWAEFDTDKAGTDLDVFSGFGYAGKTVSDDLFFEETSGSNGERYKASGGTHNYSDSEIDDLVRKAREAVESFGKDEQLATNDSDAEYSYSPPKSETFQELLSQHKSGLISDEEFEEMLLGKKPYTDPLSLINTKPEDFNTTPDVNKKTGKFDGDGTRDTIIAKGRSTIFNTAFKNDVASDDYIQKYMTITNKETLKTAAKELDEGGHDGVQKWYALHPERASTIDIVKGFIMLDRYQRAGNIDGAVRVAQKLSEMGTAAGQSVQAFSILRRMTPATMMAYAQQSLDRVREEYIKTKSKAWVDKHADRLRLTDEDINYIFNRTLYVATLPDGRDKDVAIAQIAQRLQDKLPPEKGQGIKAAQRISMLLNPKTIGRNILGNATVTPILWVSDWIGTGADKLLAIKTGLRTKSAVSDVKEDAKAFARGAYESYDDFVKKINTQIDLDRFDISKAQGKSFYEGGKLAAVAKVANAMDRMTSFFLQVGDRPFYEYWFTRSLNSQMRANKVTVPTPEMIEIATAEALERTWQDNNNVTKMVRQIKDGLNNIQIGGYGVGDVFIKFTKTPANLAKAIFEFSPVGYTTAARDAVKFVQAVKDGRGVAVAQRKFVQSLSNATAGTMLYLIAVGLFNAGLLVGGADEDDDVAAFEKWIQGIPAYSVNIGGKWFSYEWMQPIGSIAAIVSDYMEGREEGRGIENSITEALRAGGSILFEQSFMKSFQTFFTADNPLDGFLEAMFDEPSVFVPQIISQLASATDDTRRTTFDNSSKLKTALNSVLYKIPGLRQTLTEDVDVFGRTVPNSQGNFWDAFMNPANTYTDTSDEVTNHVYDLYKNLGDAKMIPSKAPYSIEVGGKKYPLTAEERAEYQRVMGTVAHKLIEYLIANDLYNSYTDEEKANVIKAVYSYADKVAKSQYKVDYTFEMAHDDDPYITRAKFDAMTDEEKQELYSKNALSSYAEILNTTEEGAVLYFANAGARSAVIHATTEYNGAQAAEIIARAKSNAMEYGGEDEEKATVSSFKSSITTYWKPFYKVAYYEGDRDTMNKIKETLLDTGLYSNYELNKKLNDWLEE